MAGPRRCRSSHRHPPAGCGAALNGFAHRHLVVPARRSRIERFGGRPFENGAINRSEVHRERVRKSFDVAGRKVHEAGRGRGRTRASRALPSHSVRRADRSAALRDPPSTTRPTASSRRSARGCSSSDPPHPATPRGCLARRSRTRAAPTRSPPCSPRRSRSARRRRPAKTSTPRRAGSGGRGGR